MPPPLAVEPDPTRSVTVFLTCGYGLYDIPGENAREADKGSPGPVDDHFPDRGGWSRKATRRPRHELGLSA
jgi:hypothetical protein